MNDTLCSNPKPVDPPQQFASIVTSDRKMQAIFRYIEAIAPTSQAVLITGETGTGKELVARAIHEVSGRGGSFVSVNVAGLDDIMFSDTLFGHCRGAFTGAERERKGLIETATDGTLFLDEIGDLNIANQVKLLRLLQEHEYYRLGADKINRSSARFLVATNSRLEDQIEKGSFRSDLYYRLCSHHIHVPPLRERKKDIPVLMEYFARDTARMFARPVPTASEETLDMLRNYEFPGNVRELEGMVRNAVTMGTTGTLVFTKLKPRITTIPAGIKIEPDFSKLPGSSGRMPTLTEAEEYLIREALRVSNGNQRAAADILGISRQALNKRLQRDARFLE
jgi:transcriptional regulator with PAS, ATPase and Fis domain